MRALRWVFAVIAAILLVAATVFFVAIWAGERFTMKGDGILYAMMACSTSGWIFAGLAFWGFYSTRQSERQP